MGLITFQCPMMSSFDQNVSSRMAVFLSVLLIMSFCGPDLGLKNLPNLLLTYGQVAGAESSHPCLHFDSGLCHVGVERRPAFGQ